LTFTFSCIFAIGAFSQYIQRYLVAIVEQTLHGHAAEHLVAALLRRRASYFEKRHVGDIYARMNSLQEIVQYVSHKLVEFWISIVTGMLALSLMLVQSPLLAGVASGIFALYIAIACVLYPRMREAHQDQSEATARADDATIETIRAGTLIKLASRETAHTAHYMRHFKRVIEAKFRVDKLENLRDAILKLVEYADTIIVAYVSVSLMLGGKVSVGVFYSFLIYKSLMAERLAQAISIGFEYFLLTVPVARIDDLIEHAAERYTPPEHRHKATEVETFERIDLSDARFSYGVSDRVVFERLSLRITRGDKIAIVGPSGVGKSTLFKLLTAMETPDAGRITLNGIDYATLAVDEVRQHMSNMRQGDIVLNGTMAENVSLLAAEPDERRIHELLGLVGLLDDVMKLPMRTRTIVSDALANISAGQRQRLLLARALYQDRELLLLDEPTSNLDDALAITIGRHLAGLRKTVVVITHDTALASLFESRYQLLDGALVKYDELLR
jgi:ATP-binding cassette subfamily B protein RaxB